MDSKNSRTRSAKLGHSVAEAANLLGVGKTSILKLVHNRELDSYKILRTIYIPSEALDAYIDKCHRPRFDPNNLRALKTGSRLKVQKNR